MGRPFLVRLDEIINRLKQLRSKREHRKSKQVARTLRVEQCEDRRMLATFTVNNFGDFTDSDPNVTTLREAVLAANGSLDAEDTIRFDETVFATGGTIFLTQGELSVTETQKLTIHGRRTDGSLLGITIDASLNDFSPETIDGGGSRVLSISTSTSLSDVTIDGLNFTGGDLGFIGDGGGGIAFSGNGKFTLRDCEIFDNASEVGGGGLSVKMLGNLGETPEVLIENCTISGNSQDDTNGGGGIYLSGHATTIQIVKTTISENSTNAMKGGGGLYARLQNAGSARSTLTVDRSTISGNTANQGGGFFFYSSGSFGAQLNKFILVNSTISGNHAIQGVGGGGYVCAKRGGEFEASNSTISGNDALDTSLGRGGGLSISRSHVSIEPPIISHLSHLTITGNRAFSGGGLFSNDDAEGDNDLLVQTTVTHSIISGNFNHLSGANQQPNNVGGDIENTSTYNLFGTGGGAVLTTGTLGAGNILNNDIPKLAPLQNNGGMFTLTHALQDDSPALNAGDPEAEAGVSVPEFDQRGEGFPRVVAGRIDIGAVEMQFIPGDYTRNGIVDCADYVLWKNTFHQTVTPFSGADGNGNGIVDAADYTIWADAYGDLNGRPAGDFDRIGVVNAADYNIWFSTFGSMTDLRADANCSGIVDAGDYTIWRDTFGSMIGAARFGLLNAAFGPNILPEVVGIYLSIANANPFDFAALVGSGEQLRSVPLTGANAISITFNQVVNVTQNALQLLNLDGTAPSIASFVYNTESQTATWTFGTALSDGRYLVRLSDSVQDADNEALDGEFLNPWSLTVSSSAAFPSGDGEEGGEFRFRFTVLAGDTDHDNIQGPANYQNWQSTEPGMIIVSTTADDWDADLTFGDVSLREAVNYANTAGTATAIQLPTGRYTLSRTGTESSANVGVNDLDIIGNIAIIGAGPGVSIIDNSGLVSAPTTDSRAFDLTNTASRLKLSRLTVANGSSSASGQVASLSGGATMEVVDCAVVNHTAYIHGAAIIVNSANLVVSRSVFSNDDVTGTYGGAAISVSGTVAAPASLTVGESVFAQNVQPGYGGYYPSTHNGIRVSGTVNKTNQGKNLYDDAGGGFFDTTPGVGDYLGTPTYVVTSVADTFNHADDLEALSLREAVDLANQASGPQTVWVPAWRFVLTRDRGSNITDTDVSYGDIDVKDSAVIRGVEGRTSIGWPPGVVDKAIELLGDVNRNGVVDAADYTLWQDQNGASGAWEQFAADIDDDGDVDEDDYDLWSANFGHTLTLSGIEV